MHLLAFFYNCSTINMWFTDSDHIIWRCLFPINKVFKWPQKQQSPSHVDISGSLLYFCPKWILSSWSFSHWNNLTCWSTFSGVNGTQICPVSIALEEDYGYYGNIPRLRYLRLDGNEIQPPIPLDIMICFRLLQAVVI